MPVKKSNKPVVLVFVLTVIVIFFVGLIGFGITYYINSRKQQNKNTEQMPNTRPSDYEQKEEEPQQGSAVFLWIF